MPVTDENGITAPVGVGDVKRVLGAATTDVGRLCTHVNLRKWAKYKPTNHVTVTNATLAEKTLTIGRGGDVKAAAQENGSQYVTRDLGSPEGWEKGDTRDIIELGADGDEGPGTASALAYAQENGFAIPCAEDDGEPEEDTAYADLGRPMWRRKGEKQAWWRSREWTYTGSAVYRLTDFEGYVQPGPQNSESIVTADIPDEVEISATTKDVEFGLLNKTYAQWNLGSLSLDDFATMAGGCFCVAFVDGATVYEFRSAEIEKGTGVMGWITSVKVPRQFFTDVFKVNGYGTGVEIPTMAYIRKGGRLFSLCTGGGEKPALRTVRYRFVSRFLYLRYEYGMMEGYVSGPDGMAYGDGRPWVYVGEGMASRPSGWTYSLPPFWFKCVVERPSTVEADELAATHSYMLVRCVARNTTRWGWCKAQVPEVVMPLTNWMRIPLFRNSTLVDVPAEGAALWGYDCCGGMVIDSSSGINDTLRTGYADERNNAALLDGGYWEGEPSSIPIVTNGQDLAGTARPTDVCFGVEAELHDDGGTAEGFHVMCIPQCGDGNVEDGMDSNYYIGLQFGTTSGSLSMHTQKEGGAFPTGNLRTAMFTEGFDGSTWLEKPDGWEAYDGLPILE